MIGATVVLQAAELIGWSGLYFRLKRKSAQKILIHGNRPQPTKLPVVDRQAKRFAGVPSKANRLMAGRVVVLLRKLVNTKAFEYLVTALFNKRSKLRSSTKKRLPIYVS